MTKQKHPLCFDPLCYHNEPETAATNRSIAAGENCAPLTGSALTETDERILRSLTLRSEDGMRMCDILSHEEGVVVSRSLQKLKRRGLIEKVVNKNRNLERWRVVGKAPNAALCDPAHGGAGKPKTL